jgi:hypothetical protein
MKVLFVSYMPPCFNEFYPLVLYMQKFGLFEPLVYFNHSKKYASHQINKCFDNNIIALDENGHRIASKEPEEDNLEKKIVNISIWIRKFLFKVNQRLSFSSELFHLLSRQKIIRKILKEYCVKGVVLGLDMAGRDSGLIVKECHAMGIPIVTLTWIFASGDDPANVYFNKTMYPEYQASKYFNKLLVKFFPSYLYFYRGVDIVRLPACKAIWYEVLDIGAPLPWVFNSGKSDSIVVDSVAMYNFYEKAGIPSSQLRLTGMPVQDKIFQISKNKEESKHKLCIEYKLDFQKPVLLAGIFPDCFHMLFSVSTCEFESYDEATRFWIQSIKQCIQKFNILFTVHPGISQTERGELEQLHGITIISVDTSTADVIPLCDLYITCVSSTMRWAIACEIPVIDFDFYGFGNQLPGFLPGVVCVRTRKEFLATINKLLNDDLYLLELRNFQESVAGDFGMLDGMACKRISEILEKHIEAYKRE